MNRQLGHPGRGPPPSSSVKRTALTGGTVLTAAVLGTLAVFILPWASLSVERSGETVSADYGHSYEKTEGSASLPIRLDGYVSRSFDGSLYVPRLSGLAAAALAGLAGAAIAGAVSIPLGFLRLSRDGAFDAALKAAPFHAVAVLSVLPMLAGVSLIGQSIAPLHLVGTLVAQGGLAEGLTFPVAPALVIVGAALFSIGLAEVHWAARDVRPAASGGGADDV